MSPGQGRNKGASGGHRMWVLAQCDAEFVYLISTVYDAGKKPVVIAADVEYDIAVLQTLGQVAQEGVDVCFCHERVA